MFYSCVIPKISDTIELAIILVLTIVLQLLSDFYMILTSTTNPGIIPKLEVDISLLSRISRTRPQTTKYLDRWNGVRTKLTYWATWLIIRPPRTYHWYFWDNCVEVFDHHWPWISWWIGKRNYLYFILFLTFQSCLIFLTIIISVKVWTDEEGNTLKAVRYNVPAILIIIYNFSIGCFVVTLTLYHYVIILRGETTHENLKHFYRNTKNPFAKGILRNCFGRAWLPRGKWKYILMLIGSNKMREKFNLFEVKPFKFTKANIDLIHIRNESNFKPAKHLSNESNIHNPRSMFNII